MSSEQPENGPRKSLPGVEDVFVERWSPRFYRRKPVPERDLAVMIDAARWSPSCYNEQPWHFYTSTEESYSRFLDLLVESNQRWAVSAPVLGFVATLRQFTRTGKPNAHAAFDAGAAWMAFNLQASMMGYRVHGMAGIRYTEVYRFLDLDPETYEVICGFALGEADSNAAEERSGRKTLAEIWRRI